jgi:hypothetical protein
MENLNPYPTPGWFFNRFKTWLFRSIRFGKRQQSCLPCIAYACETQELILAGEALILKRGFVCWNESDELIRTVLAERKRRLHNENWTVANTLLRIHGYNHISETDKSALNFDRY